MKARSPAHVMVLLLVLGAPASARRDADGSVLAPAASFDGLEGLGNLTLRRDDGWLQPGAPEAALDAEGSSGEVRPAFGQAGQTWWTLSAGAGWDFDETVAINALLVSWSNFLDDDFEWLVEGGLWGFSQPGDDAFGGSLSTIFRWHAWNNDRWSAYLDIGIGLGLHSEPVPEDGTRYDFMPRAGVGLTRLLDDSGTRLQVGLRWQHWSNAHLEGDEDNPPLDTAALYFGVMWQGR
jgi:hypothetical protein